MVKTIDATTTDRLRRSPLYLDLSPSCARKRACMELTTICRFQRLKIPLFDFFSALAFGMFRCKQQCINASLTNQKNRPFGFWFANSNVSTHWKHAEGMSLRYDAIFTLWCNFDKPVQNLFSSFSVIWEIIKPYKVGKYLIGFHLQLLYIRYLMTTW